jgi:hypothetical protein
MDLAHLPTAVEDLSENPPRPFSETKSTASYRMAIGMSIESFQGLTEKERGLSGIMWKNIGYKLY